MQALANKPAGRWCWALSLFLVCGTAAGEPEMLPVPQELIELQSRYFSNPQLLDNLYDPSVPQARPLTPQEKAAKERAAAGSEPLVIRVFFGGLSQSLDETVRHAETIETQFPAQVEFEFYLVTHAQTRPKDWADIGSLPHFEQRGAQIDANGRLARKLKVTTLPNTVFEYSGRSVVVPVEKMAPTALRVLRDIASSRANH